MTAAAYEFYPRVDSTEPDLQDVIDWEEADHRSLRERVADRLEDLGVAVAHRYWTFVRIVRGRP
jgi:hypothetical protein